MTICVPHLLEMADDMGEGGGKLAAALGPSLAVDVQGVHCQGPRLSVGDIHNKNGHSVGPKTQRIVRRPENQT